MPFKVTNGVKQKARAYPAGIIKPYTFYEEVQELAYDIIKTSADSRFGVDHTFEVEANKKYLILKRDSYSVLIYPVYKNSQGKWIVGAVCDIPLSDSAQGFSEDGGGIISYGNEVFSLWNVYIGSSNKTIAYDFRWKSNNTLEYIGRYNLLYDTDVVTACRVFPISSGVVASFCYDKYNRRGLYVRKQPYSTSSEKLSSGSVSNIISTSIIQSMDDIRKTVNGWFIIFDVVGYQVHVISYNDATNAIKIKSTTSLGTSDSPYAALVPLDLTHFAISSGYSITIIEVLSNGKIRYKKKNNYEVYMSGNMATQLYNKNPTIQEGNIYPFLSSADGTLGYITIDKSTLDILGEKLYKCLPTDLYHQSGVPSDGEYAHLFTWNTKKQACYTEVAVHDRPFYIKPAEESVKGIVYKTAKSDELRECVFEFNPNSGTYLSTQVSNAIASNIKDLAIEEVQNELNK